MATSLPWLAAGGAIDRLMARAFAWMTPALVLVCTVLVLPAAYVAWLSLTASTYGQAPEYVGLANYAKVLGDPYFWRAMRNTLVIVVVVVHVELLLGLGMALLFNSGVPMRRLMLAAVLAPYAVSEVSAAVVWRFLFDMDAGPANWLLQGLGLPALEWSVVPSHGLALVILLSIWLHLPFTFLILYAARLAIPGDLYESARIDGATPWQAFRHVLLPMAVPILMVVFVLAFIGVIIEYPVASILLREEPNLTLAVGSKFFLYDQRYLWGDFAAAAVLSGLPITLVFLAAQRWIVSGLTAGGVKG